MEPYGGCSLFCRMLSESIIFLCMEGKTCAFAYGTHAPSYAPGVQDEVDCVQDTLFTGVHG